MFVNKGIEKDIFVARKGKRGRISGIRRRDMGLLCKDDTGSKYFQVAATVREQTTLQRELLPLQKIRDHYPKFFLTLDEDPAADYDGIRRINALDWLPGE